MNQVALPESQPDPEDTPVLGMRARLLALATLCVAGSLALTGGLALHRASLEQRSIEDGALTVARAIVSAADREIAASIARMEALATSPALHADDLEAFHRQLAATPLPDGTWFVLWDRERQLLNTLRPIGAPCRGSPTSMLEAKQPYEAPLRHARPWSARWSGGSRHRPTSSRSRSPSWSRMR